MTFTGGVAKGRFRSVSWGRVTFRTGCHHQSGSPLGHTKSPEVPQPPRRSPSVNVLEYQEGLRIHHSGHGLELIENDAPEAHVIFGPH